MQIIKGNLLDITSGVIIHQVNNKHVMGAGVAKAIRSKYPQHYIDYSSQSLRMGELVKTHINSKFGIIGIIAQNGFGTDRQYTCEQSFRVCLERIKSIHEINPLIKFYMPYGIGCGLAGGTWSVISELIEFICPFIILIKL